MSQVRGGKTLPNGWEATAVIGEGSYGVVYRARRVIGGNVEWAAVKHISVPRNQSELNSICAELGTKDIHSINRYLSTSVQDMLDEYFKMKSLQGHTNIVACHDIQQVPKKGGIGFDIYIWMELLDSLSNRILEGTMNRSEVLRMGLDICQALSLLKSKGMVHRDIKPQNILVNEHGDYKLGDFGTARSMKGTSTLLSLKGTFAYIPPEIIQGRRANYTSDIYSLGLVMYRLLNHNRPPFVKDGEEQNARILEDSNARRLSGEALPNPAEAGRSLGSVILKACAFRPEDRWQTPEEMFHALNAQNEGTPRPGMPAAAPSGSAAATLSRAAGTSEPPRRQEKKKSRKAWLMIPILAALPAIYLLACLLTGTNVWPPFSTRETPTPAVTVSIVPTPGETETPVPTESATAPGNTTEPATGGNGITLPPAKTETQPPTETAVAPPPTTGSETAPVLTLQVEVQYKQNKLTWNPVDGAVSYTVLRHMSDKYPEESRYTERETTTETEYTDEVRYSYKYYYTVIANDADGNEICKSNEVELVAATRRPDAPDRNDVPARTATPTPKATSTPKGTGTPQPTSTPSPTPEILSQEVINKLSKIMSITLGFEDYDPRYDVNGDGVVNETDYLIVQNSALGI